MSTADTPTPGGVDSAYAWLRLGLSMLGMIARQRAAAK